MQRIISAWHGRRLSTITKAEIHALLDKQVDAGAPVAANRCLSWLNGLCNWAIGRGLIDANPCAGIKPPTVEASRDRILDDGELAAVLKAADVLAPPYGAFVYLLALTGQRRTEVGHLVWPEIDLAKKVWTLPAARAKNKRGHEIPLSNMAVEILRALPRFAGCDFVLSVNGRNAINCHGKVKERLERLMPTLPPWTLHDLRRTCASGMARLGVQLPTIEKILNHTGGSFAGIVGVYQRHSFADEMRAAVETWARHIETIVAGQASAVVPMVRHAG